MTITREQLSFLISALNLGNYFLEGQDPTGEQYESDRDTMLKAWSIIKEIEAK